MIAPLDLAPFLVRLGDRVVVARAESRRARDAYANAEAKRLRQCREKFQ